MTRFVLLMGAMTVAAQLAALPASAQQMRAAPTHAINPSLSLSSRPADPVQQQILEDYRTRLLGAQRDLLQSNPSGLGREQIAIGHELDGYNTMLR